MRSRVLVAIDFFRDGTNAPNHFIGLFAVLLRRHDERSRERLNYLTFAGLVRRNLSSLSAQNWSRKCNNGQRKATKPLHGGHHGR
jgi:hypothetical protein